LIYLAEKQRFNYRIAPMPSVESIQNGPATPQQKNNTNIGLPAIQGNIKASIYIKS
jgi:hypothetical protein